MTEYLAIGQKYRPLLEQRLRELGLSVLWLPDNPDVAPALCGHADLSAAALRTGSETRCFLAPCLKQTDFAPLLSQIGHTVEYILEKQVSVYPGDVFLNVRQIGNTIFLNRKTASSAVLHFLDKHPELRQIHINQGYAACCILPCGEHSLVTADDGIASAAIRAGFDVLKIAPGFIELPGFPCGFIGGSAFPIGTGRIAFTGTMDNHPDQERIFDFLKKQSIAPVYLTDLPLFDIGGAVSITANLFDEIS